MTLDLRKLKVKLYPGETRIAIAFYAETPAEADRLYVALYEMLQAGRFDCTVPKLHETDVVRGKQEVAA